MATEQYKEKKNKSFIPHETSFAFEKHKLVGWNTYEHRNRYGKDTPDYPVNQYIEGGFPNDISVYAQWKENEITMIGTNDLSSYFNEDTLPDLFAYTNFDGQILSPFTNDPNVGTSIMSLAQVIDQDGIVSKISNYAFYCCTSLTTVSFPICTSIGQSAFRGCTSLTTVSFPACKTIGPDAFHNCKSLTTASFPSCTMIDQGAFGYCSSLTSLYLMSTAVVSLASTDVFDSSPLSKGGSGMIYVPSSLVTVYKATTNWTYFSARITGI